MSFARADLDRLHAALVEAAQSEVMTRFRRLSAGEVRAKAHATDLVTEADEAAERRIVATLSKAYPNALFVGEEAATADPSLLAKLGEADLAFVIDPIDGTLNYASDLPLFAVMAAAIIKGEIVGAVIHDPILGDAMLALRGEGAWLAHQDGSTRDLRVGAGGEPSTLSGLGSWRYFPEPLRSKMPACWANFANVASLRCCGQEYRLAAAGRADFLVYGKLNPWDHAPGALLVREAGGVVKMFDGSDYDPRRQGVGLLCAPDEETWRAIRALLPPG
jgi:fructose-1,6-bisphosphatase/inositol monophosphatase family enzyme